MRTCHLIQVIPSFLTPIIESFPDSFKLSLLSSTRKGNHMELDVELKDEFIKEVQELKKSSKQLSTG